MSDEPRLSVNQFMVPDTDLRELADWCARDGLGGIGVLRDTLDRLGARTVRGILDDAGLAATSVCVFLGLVAPTAARRRVLLDDARRAADHATELGAPLVIVPGGPSPDVPLADARAQFATQFADLARHTAHGGGRLLLEPLHPAAVHLSAVTSLADAVSLVRSTPGTGLLLDLWHMWTDPDFSVIASDHAREGEMIHVSDWPAEPTRIHQREIPGKGIMDLPTHVGGLIASGFRGWWELEVFATDPAAGMGDESLYQESLKGLRDVLARACSDEPTTL
ncbi:sugar phosphate isomerase/epimerase family protein [Streptomyces sp. NPDC007084]|uniref:sugar phosphate isomerase/epimerase family protein n=1 Tax=Streptomyces sp. NPDC007084 TaxID=3154313 RepID=UPI0034545A5E